VRSKIVVAVALALVLVAARVTLWRRHDVTGAAPADGFVRVPGVVHVHTTFSDGAGKPDDVIRAARATGTRFVVITDHNNVDARSLEGYHDGVLLIAGSELSTASGHILGLGIEDPAYRFSGDPWDALEDIHDLGGFAVAAHPLSPRADLQFKGWDLPGPWGVELVNGDSEWRTAGWRTLLTPALYALNRPYALLRLLNSPEPMLARWDRLLSDRDVAGLAGLDAHGGLVSYESLFGLVRNYAVLAAPLTGQFDEDRRAVLGALQHGRSYIGIDALANAADFSFVGETQGRRATMGDTVVPNVRLKAGGRLPAGARLVLLRDGTPIVDTQDALDYEAPMAGVYRIEVHVAGARTPWILSNPIYVFDATAQAKREARAAWPAGAEAPAATLVLDGFGATTAFQPGADSRSTIGKPVLDPHGGSAGGGAARLEFRLGERAPDDAGVFAALADWTPRDLRGHSGLVFSVRADGVYRMWVQVRDENKASEDGTEWWVQSVRTSTAWRRVAVPFAHLRSMNVRTDGRLDLDKIRALVFVVDRGSVKPGTHGTIWLDGLGVY
jgi:PHP domain-containing protein/carbohydrate binding protein with CBM11 domain